ncbi:MAG TPA: zinc-ribbon domain-containing protein, partial [Candidatus Limnocylindrales bacterium]
MPNMNGPRFCPHCGVPRAPEAAFCPNCGERLDGQRPARQRRGNRMGTGALLAIVGGAFLFGPFSPSDLGKVSLWQAHDLCSSLFGSILPSSCSTLTLLWVIGIGLLGLGILVVAANLFRPGDPP